MLPYLVDPEGWLPVWMLKSDELCVLLTGFRLWDVFYKADSDCLEGCKAVEMSSLNSVASKELIKSYQTKPVLPYDEAFIMLRYVICEHAFINSLNIEGRKTEIKNCYHLYTGTAKPALKNGDIFSFPCKSHLVNKPPTSFLYEFQSRMNELKLLCEGNAEMLAVKEWDTLYNKAKNIFYFLIDNINPKDDLVLSVRLMDLDEIKQSLNFKSLLIKM